MQVLNKQHMIIYATSSGGNNLIECAETNMNVISEVLDARAYIREVDKQNILFD